MSQPLLSAFDGFSSALKATDYARYDPVGKVCLESTLPWILWNVERSQLEPGSLGLDFAGPAGHVVVHADRSVYLKRSSGDLLRIATVHVEGGTWRIVPDEFYGSPELGFKKGEEKALEEYRNPQGQTIAQFYAELNSPAGRGSTP